MKEYVLNQPFILLGLVKGGAYVIFPLPICRLNGIKGRLKVQATFDGVDYQEVSSIWG